MILSTVLGKMGWKRQMSELSYSSLENGMWVKEWSYLWYFISFSFIGGDDLRPQDVVQSGKPMLSGERLLCTWYHTCKLRGCWWTIYRWPCCRSGENVKTASHSSCRIGYDSDFINVHEDNQFYDMMIEAMAGRKVSWYSFIGNLNPGRHDVYEAQTISKTKTISSMCFIHGVGTHQNALPLENA